jgi:hypothetical protein
MNSIFANGIAIHFINRIEREGYYVYDMEVENIGVDGITYDMKGLKCSNGENVLTLNEFDMTGLESKTLLNEGAIVVGVERVSGIVAFKMDITISNDPPLFTYEQKIISSYSAQIGGV